MPLQSGDTPLLEVADVSMHAEIGEHSGARIDCSLHRHIALIVASRATIPPRLFSRPPRFSSEMAEDDET